MTADPNPAPERYEYALLDLIHVSKSNPRKHVDDAALQELASSIKDHGIIEPIIVQDLGTKGYEIVAGERRYLAAKIAKLVEVPVIVRPFSAEEMPLVRLIENLQRQDLNAIDLAHGYQTLMKDFKYTADQVADLVKKSRRHVYATMQLLTLLGDGRKALENGELSASVASLLARVPEKRQADAFQKLRGYNTLIPDATGLSVRHAEEVLRNFIGQPLNNVPWKLDDAELLPEQGPCTTCQFNARNIPDLVDVYPDADVCTSIEGFKAKQTAQHKRDQARFEGKNVKVLTAAESKKLTQYGQFYPSRAGFAALTDAATHGEDSKTYGQILKGKNDVTIYVGRGPKGGEVKLVKLADVKPHLKAAGVVVNEPHRVVDYNSPEEKEKREAAAALLARAHLILTRKVHERMPKVKVTTALIPLLIHAVKGFDRVPQAVREVRNLKLKGGWDAEQKWLKTLKADDVFPVFLEAAMSGHDWDAKKESLNPILKYCGLPPYAEMLTDAKKQAGAELKAEAKPAPKATTKKKSAKAKKVAK